MTPIVRGVPLGESALQYECRDEDSAAALARAVRDANDRWLVDVVASYVTVAVFFDREFDRLAIDAAIRSLSLGGDSHAAPRRHVIPVCYERGPDLDRVAEATGLDRDAVIALHAGAAYTVYAIGFCPGFPYLGYLPPKLCDVPRLPSPRVRVPAGSVGLTGRQTGIYTEPRPGGWNLIGQTPLTLVDVADEYFPLATGDQVLFQRIDESEFEKRKGERLP